MKRNELGVSITVKGNSTREVLEVGVSTATLNFLNAPHRWNKNDREEGRTERD